MFGTAHQPIIVKSDSEASQQLVALETLLIDANPDDAKKIEREIRLVKAGIAGENRIMFELKNSHMPLYALHDIRLAKDNLAAQIDFLVITKYCIFVIECKNLYGDIEVNSRGEFTRTIFYGSYRKHEGLYSPITQNQRHLDLLREIRCEAKKNILTKALFLSNFENAYQGVVVLANEKTVLNARYAKRELTSQIVKVDQLLSYMKAKNASSKQDATSYWAMKNLADFYLAKHVPSEIDYVSYYRTHLHLQDATNQLDTAAAYEAMADKMATSKDSANTPICPQCGKTMIKRKAKRGSYVGNEFWGCTGFPQCRCIVPITTNRDHGAL